MSMKIIIDGVAGVWTPNTEVPPVTPPTQPPTFNAAAFYDSIRESLFSGALSQQQVDGINLIGSTCIAAGLAPLTQQTAYVLATVYHETARTMQPIEEYGGPSTRYAPWYGRGHVQLTWEANYQKQEDKHGHMGEEFKVHEDWNRALIPAVSATICVYGMRDGDFTGKGLGDYISRDTVDYVKARRVVNGADKAATIAGYAEDFETALQEGQR